MINVAELLKDCPSGMELDCTVYDNCTFKCILDENCYPIQIQTPEGNMQLSQYGCMSLSKHANCIIFPKGKTTWEGFVPPCKFKDGDIVTSLNTSIYIFTNCSSTVDGYFFAPCGLIADHKGENHHFNVGTISISVDNMRLASEEEKQKLFDAIKENGYKWNVETKTLEKLVTIFKVGDKIKLKNAYAKKYDDFNTRKITEIEHSHYILDDKTMMPLSNQYLYELVPNKFDISTLVPFESRVLVRDNVREKKWKPAIWGYYDLDHINGYPYKIVGGNCFYFCIPYEGNEHLLGTANDCDDFYKTW